jgi:hypothetical protein
MVHDMEGDDLSPLLADRASAELRSSPLHSRKNSLLPFELPDSRAPTAASDASGGGRPRTASLVADHEDQGLGRPVLFHRPFTNWREVPPGQGIMDTYLGKLRTLETPTAGAEPGADERQHRPPNVENDVQRVTADASSCTYSAPPQHPPSPHASAHCSSLPQDATGTHTRDPPRTRPQGAVRGRLAREAAPRDR